MTRKSKIGLIAFVVVCTHCTKSSESVLAVSLLDEKLISENASMRILNQTKRPRENTYVIHISGDNLAGNEVLQKKYRKLGMKDKEGDEGKFVFAEIAKWLPPLIDPKKLEIYSGLSEKNKSVIYVIIISNDESIIIYGSS